MGEVRSKGKKEVKVPEYHLKNLGAYQPASAIMLRKVVFLARCAFLYLRPFDSCCRAILRHPTLQLIGHRIATC